MKKDYINYGTTTIDYTLTYADRKTLGVQVTPEMDVLVTAPTDALDEKIKERLLTKAAWIERQKDFFLSFYPKTPPRRFIAGETHLYLGKQYRLKIEESDIESVKMARGYITVATKTKSDSQRIEKQLKAWYEQKAAIYFTKLFNAHAPIARDFYEGTPTLKFRWMKKRWGSCHANGQILLNVELMKAPKACIEYVIVHELCHLVHLNHSGGFYKLLGVYLPGWERVKERLERAMV
jgi:predicted metal-dependent hydrolase